VRGLPERQMSMLTIAPADSLIPLHHSSGPKTQSSRRCSVLVDESAQYRASPDRTLVSCLQVWPVSPTGRRMESHRSVEPVVVVSGCTGLRPVRRCRRPGTSIQSRHSARTVPTHRSAWAFAFGAWIGVEMTRAPSASKTASKEAVNFVSWSWIRKRGILQALADPRSRSSHAG
jgi:hypothetical protein